MQCEWQDRQDSSQSLTQKARSYYLGSSSPCSTPQAISLTALLISCLDVYAKQTFRKHLQRGKDEKGSVWEGPADDSDACL